MSEIERHAKVMADARELGARRAQVSLLREALVRYGTHADYCSGDRCRCGLAEALLVGAGAEQACGIKEQQS